MSVLAWTVTVVTVTVTVTVIVKVTVVDSDSDRRQVSPVTCHLSPVNNANSHSHTLPLLAPPLFAEGLFTNPQNPKKYNTKKTSKLSKKGIYFANIRDMPLKQKFPVHRDAGFPGGDNNRRHSDL